MKTLRFEIELEASKTRFVPYDKPDLIYLIDTGADTPVWCKGEEEFLDVYKDAERIPVKFLLSGFGKGIDVVDVYRIPIFELTDGTQSVFFKNLVVAITNRPEMDLDMVLPVSIFRHMKIEIDYMTSVSVPTLDIITENDTVPIFFKKGTLTDDQMEKLGINDAGILKGVYWEQ